VKHLELLESNSGLFRYGPLDLLIAADLAKPTAFATVQSPFAATLEELKPLMG
jgi:hypothetical protein